MARLEVMPHQLVGYSNRNVLITGHTGFKGAWLSAWLTKLGARVTGFSLPKWDNDKFFTALKPSLAINDRRGDVTDGAQVRAVIEATKPDIVFHLAAQPLVGASYQDPLGTFATNVTGTVHVLDAIRSHAPNAVAVMVTSDKCYKNDGRNQGYVESDALGGSDPYSASKAAAEIVVSSYRNSFFGRGRIASVRAGNIVGGGDHSTGRIVPDCIAALEAGLPVTLRNPGAVRPWQYVLDALYGYLLVGARLMAGDAGAASAWNFGPAPTPRVTVAEVADLVIARWSEAESRRNSSATWRQAAIEQTWSEAKYLTLDSSKAQKLLDWRPRLSVEDALTATVECYRKNSTNAFQVTEQKLVDFMQLIEA